MSHLAQLTLERFQPWVVTRFLVSHPEGTDELELVRAAALPRHRAEMGERFSLLFRGPVEVPLPQRTYAFDHPQVGPFELFLVPVVSRERGSIHYEAIVNREVMG